MPTCRLSRRPRQAASRRPGRTAARRPGRGTGTPLWPDPERGGAAAAGMACRGATGLPAIDRPSRAPGVPRCPTSTPGLEPAGRSPRRPEARSPGQGDDGPPGVQQPPDCRRQPALVGLGKRPRRGRVHARMLDRDEREVPVGHTLGLYPTCLGAEAARRCPSYCTQRSRPEGRWGQGPGGWRVWRRPYRHRHRQRSVHRPPGSSARGGIPH